MLQNALDPSLARDLRLFVHLTTHLYTTGIQSTYHGCIDGDIQIVRNFVGNRLLLALDPLLRPSEIEASKDKLGRLRSLFLLLLGTVVGMRYICPEVSDGHHFNISIYARPSCLLPPFTHQASPNDGHCLTVTDKFKVFEGTTVQKTELEAKQDALLRLLCHYLIHIGRTTGMLEDANETSLLCKWKKQWDKAAAFTWSSSQGLEMHYRIEPPADWIVSSSENESLSSIDIDLSEFDEFDEFTQGSDLLKCTMCNTFWTLLDSNGICGDCQAIAPSSSEPDTSLLRQTNSMCEGSAPNLCLDAYSSLESILDLDTSQNISSSYELV